MDKRIRPLKQRKLPTAFDVAISQSTNLIATIGRNVVVTDGVNFKKISSSHPLSHPSHISFDNDGKRLVVKSTSGQIVIINPVSGETLVDYKNKKEGEGANVLFSPCDDYIIDASWDGYIHIRNSHKPEIKEIFPHEGEMITNISSTKDRSSYLFLHSPKCKSNGNIPPPDYLTLWEWKSGLIKIKEFHFNKEYIIQNAVISPDGHFIILLLDDINTKIMRLEIIDTATGGVRNSTLIPERTLKRGLKWSDDSTYLGSIQQHGIVIYRASDLTRLITYNLQYPSDVAFAPDNSYLVLGTWSYGLIQPVDFSKITGALN